MKKWLTILSLMLFFVAGNAAANSDFLGVREGVAAKTSINAIKIAEGGIPQIQNAANRIGKPWLGVEFSTPFYS